jgi:hypothetical protein
LKNVIVGLYPNSAVSTDLNLIFALPPIPNEKIISFRIVPTYNKRALTEKEGNNPTVDITPGLLLLVQKPTDSTSLGQVERFLYSIRCPTVDIPDWGLEIGTLEDPRKAKEVQPAATEITVSLRFFPLFESILF